MMQPTGQRDITATGYDSRTKVMAVQFESGRILHFPNIRPEEYSAFRACEWFGQHYSRNFHGRPFLERVNKGRTKQGPG